MKLPLILFLLIGLLLPAACTHGEEANGLRMTSQKTTLEKNKDRDAFYQWDKVEKALGIRVNLRNISLQDLPEGSLAFIVIVKRWGRTPTLYESYTGTEKIPALLKNAEANLIVGKIPLGGYEIGGNRKQFQDSIEGWQLIATHDSKETLKTTSTSTFEKLLAKAKPAGH